MEIILETERLTLSVITLEDAPFFLELMNSPDWIRFIGDRQVKTLDAITTYLAGDYTQSHALRGFGNYLVRLKENSTPIGTCGLFQRPGLEHVDIGFSLLPEFRGKGYAFEATKVVLQFAKTIDLKRVEAITSKENKPSQRLLEKIGLSFEKHITLPKDKEEVMLYAIDLSG